MIQKIRVDILYSTSFKISNSSHFFGCNISQNKISFFNFVKERNKEELFSHIFCIPKNYVRSVVLIRFNVLCKVFVLKCFFTLVSFQVLIPK